jgi:flagellar protein FlaH
MAILLESEARVVSTGNNEVDKKLGGGIPVGSLVLVEGQSDSGKSVVSQHFAHGALNNKLATVYYTTENTVKSLISQMNSLDLDVTDYFLCDRLRIYPVLCDEDTDSARAFSLLLAHFRTLPVTTKLIIVDSLTGMVSHGDERSVIDFFSACKQLCDHGKTIICVVHSDAFDERMLIRIRSLCDAHLTLRMEQVGDRLVKMLEVGKVRNADQSTGNVISFDVEPGLGMRIIPSSRAKA